MMSVFLFLVSDYNEYKSFYRVNSRVLPPWLDSPSFTGDLVGTNSMNQTN